MHKFSGLDCLLSLNETRKVVIIRRRLRDDKAVGLYLAIPLEMAAKTGFKAGDPMSIKPTEDQRGLVLRKMVEETLDSIPTG
jgi:hypothetical protein